MVDIERTEECYRESEEGQSGRESRKRKSEEVVRNEEWERE